MSVNKNHQRVKLDKAAGLSTEAVKDDDNAGLRVVLGCHVLLCDVDTGEEMKCKIVDSRQAASLQGKISAASPVGKAVLNRREGDEIEVRVPVGKRRYRVKRVTR